MIHNEFIHVGGAAVHEAEASRLSLARRLRISGAACRNSDGRLTQAIGVYTDVLDCLSPGICELLLSQGLVLVLINATPVRSLLLRRGGQRLILQLLFTAAATTSTTSASTTTAAASPDTYGRLLATRRHTTHVTNSVRFACYMVSQ